MPEADGEVLAFSWTEFGSSDTEGPDVAAVDDDVGLEVSEKRDDSRGS